MTHVLPFPRRIPITCQDPSRESPLTALFSTGATCPRCAGRGVVFFTRKDGLPDYLPCPCGGTDEDRIDLSDFDGGA